MLCNPGCPSIYQLPSFSLSVSLCLCLSAPPSEKVVSWNSFYLVCSDNLHGITEYREAYGSSLGGGRAVNPTQRIVSAATTDSLGPSSVPTLRCLDLPVSDKRKVSCLSSLSANSAKDSYSDVARQLFRASPEAPQATNCSIR